jgi:hypothetical protein
MKKKKKKPELSKGGSRNASKGFSKFSYSKKEPQYSNSKREYSYRRKLLDITDPQANANERRLQTTISPTSSASFFGSTTQPLNNVIANQFTPAPSSVGTSTILPTSFVLADATSSPPVNQARWNQPTDLPTSGYLDVQQLDQQPQGGGGGGSQMEEFMNRFFGGDGSVQENVLPPPLTPGKPKPGKPGFPFKLKPIGKPKPGKKKPKPGKKKKPKPGKKKKPKPEKKIPEVKYSYSKGDSKGVNRRGLRHVERLD